MAILKSENIPKFYHHIKGKRAVMPGDISVNTQDDITLKRTSSKHIFFAILIYVAVLYMYGSLSGDH